MTILQVKSVPETALSLFWQRDQMNSFTLIDLNSFILATDP